MIPGRASRHWHNGRVANPPQVDNLPHDGGSGRGGVRNEAKYGGWGLGGRVRGGWGGAAGGVGGRWGGRVWGWVAKRTQFPGFRFRENPLRRSPLRVGAAGGGLGGVPIPQGGGKRISRFRRCDDGGAGRSWCWRRSRRSFFT